MSFSFGITPPITAVENSAFPEIFPATYFQTTLYEEKVYFPIS